MSGTHPKPLHTRFAEQHLGDRLSALVDGELGHETRERVLAHLATCARCKAEADAQRRLKNVFAEAAPPPPSASLLARLQGLPGGDGDSPLSGPGLPGRGGEPGVFDLRGGDRFAFGYAPVGHTPAEERGFRIHPVGRPEAERGSSRGLRFAVAAAGAVSLAAVALGGVTTALPGDSSAEARTGAGSGSVLPARSAGAVPATPETQRRRTLAAQPARSDGTPAAATSRSAPLLPGMPAQSTGPVREAVNETTTPLMAGVAAVSPLIRPPGPVTPYPLSAWTAAPPTPTNTPTPTPATTPTPTPRGHESR
ncbi:zf-HC2 domain-containing protein [Streptomyces sp. J2-1]|uniref:zf-HC2 domain-containing protein n=1 Tax=Streptomyces corallincola TaxID=2851888 RepID=UPI001C395713|nr:zf-HC2 domain-containing protein [Streptomyces corallincola]MBV2353109.1 zf-HC2 domain-containing protein [Streptomyces corallincola]